jgi:hypothetical protein
MIACIVAKKKVETNIKVMPRIGLLMIALDGFTTDSADDVDTAFVPMACRSQTAAKVDASVYSVVFGLTRVFF